MVWVAYCLDLSPQAKPGKLDEDVRAADFESSTYAMGLLGRVISGADYANAARTLQMAA